MEALHACFRCRSLVPAERITDMTLRWGGNYVVLPVCDGCLDQCFGVQFLSLGE